MKTGKWLAQFALLLAALALAAVLAWFVLENLSGRSYEKEGTLVQAFVENPQVRMQGETDIIRSTNGL